MRCGTDVNAPLWQAQKGETALFLAARGNRLEVVRLLLDRGAAMNIREKVRFEDDSALLFSALLLHNELTWPRLSFSHAQIYGDTPLKVAARYGRKEVVRLLLDYGADMNARCKVRWAAFALCTGSSAFSILASAAMRILHARKAALAPQRHLCVTHPFAARRMATRR